MYYFHNHNTCEFHLHVQGLWRTFKNHVLSLLGVAYTSTCHSVILEVYFWLLIVPLCITGIRGEPTVLEGNNLQLTCEALSRLKPNITWTKEKPGNQGCTGVVQEGKVLTVTNIKRTDAGQFTCTAYNGFGKPENRTVYVNVTCEYEFKKIDYVKRRCTFQTFNCIVMYRAVNYLNWCSVRYIHAGLQAQFFKKWPFHDLQL